MTLEDPFYVVKDEVFKALNKTRGLYLRWQEVSKSPIVPNSPEVEWTLTELKNALRSIEWDLEDLEDTISIVEKNSSKFKIDNKEICDRRSFIEATKQEVKGMKFKMSLRRGRDSDGTARVPLLASESLAQYPMDSSLRYSEYSKLKTTDSPSRFDSADSGELSQQEAMRSAQDEHLLGISNSVGALKSVSKQIGLEIDEQEMMLDDLRSEIEHEESRLDSSVRHIGRVLHITSNNRQWLIIGLLILIIFLILILFIVF